MLYICLYLLLFSFQKKNDLSFRLGKNSKVMPQLSHYLSFLLGKGGKSLYLKPYFKLQNTASASSNRPIQHTSLDLRCVCDAPQNCPILQNVMYILHEFCTFPVTEGNEILHLHCSLQLQAENSSKNP